jgi:hypothetical protein
MLKQDRTGLPRRSWEPSPSWPTHAMRTLLFSGNAKFLERTVALLPRNFLADPGETRPDRPKRPPKALVSPTEAEQRQADYYADHKLAYSDWRTAQCKLHRVRLRQMISAARKHGRFDPDTSGPEPANFGTPPLQQRSSEPWTEAASLVSDSTLPQMEEDPLPPPVPASEYKTLGNFFSEALTSLSASKELAPTTDLASASSSNTANLPSADNRLAQIKKAMELLPKVAQVIGAGANMDSEAALIALFALPPEELFRTLSEHFWLPSEALVAIATAMDVSHTFPGLNFGNQVLLSACMCRWCLSVPGKLTQRLARTDRRAAVTIDLEAIMEQHHRDHHLCGSVSDKNGSMESIASTSFPKLLEEILGRQELDSEWALRFRVRQPHPLLRDIPALCSIEASLAAKSKAVELGLAAPDAAVPPTLTDMQASQLAAPAAAAAASSAFKPAPARKASAPSDPTPKQPCIVCGIATGNHRASCNDYVRAQFEELRRAINPDNDKKYGTFDGHFVRRIRLVGWTLPGIRSLLLPQLQELSGMARIRVEVPLFLEIFMLAWPIEDAGLVLDYQLVKAAIWAVATRDPTRFDEYAKEERKTTKSTEETGRRRKTLDMAKDVFTLHFLPTLIAEDARKPYDFLVDRAMAHEYAQQYETMATNKVTMHVVATTLVFIKERLRDSGFPNKYLGNATKQVWQAMLDNVPDSSLDAEYLELGLKVEDGEVTEEAAAAADMGKDDPEANAQEELLTLAGLGEDEDIEEDESDDDEDPVLVEKRRRKKISNEDAEIARKVLAEVRHCWTDRVGDQFSLDLSKNLVRRVSFHLVGYLQSDI